jgi:hypothetical protein
VAQVLTGRESAARSLFFFNLGQVKVRILFCYVVPSPWNRGAAMTKKMTIFATKSHDGRELAQAIADNAESAGLTVDQKYTFDQSHVFRSVMTDNIVVFDATIESGSTHNLAHAVPLMLCADHVLIVSRSYLPLNFTSLRDAIAPPYPFGHPHPHLDANNALGSWSNQTIILRVMHDGTVNLASADCRKARWAERCPAIRVIMQP